MHPPLANADRGQVVSVTVPSSVGLLPGVTLARVRVRGLGVPLRSPWTSLELSVQNLSQY
jgi:hypothetical protein